MYQRKNKQTWDVNKTPEDICTIPPHKNIMIKFATDKNFKNAFIQFSDKKLFKISIPPSNYRASYDMYKRGVFSDYDVSREKIRRIFETGSD